MPLFTHKQRIAIRTTQERYRFDPPAYEELKRQDQPWSIFLCVFHANDREDERISADFRRLKGIWKTVPKAP